MPPRAELIAHRGASRERPENTLAAFTRAIELGADAVELDVHLTADGHLVVHHDPGVGGGLFPKAIGSLTLEQLGEFRIQGEPIPTFQQVVDAVGGRVRIYCELKGLGTAAPATRLLAPLGLGGAVHSFDHRMIADARAAVPDVPRGILEAAYHRDRVGALRDVAARDLWQSEALIDEQLVNEVHAVGGRVIAWTVNRPERAQYLASIGVDGICTDDVAGTGKALVRG